MTDRYHPAAFRPVKKARYVTDAPETIEVETTPVGCDGGGGALGHPLVYLPLHDGSADCPYCSRHFKLKHGARVGH
ncbi:zinc-finger domain-containing protein [Roseiterribacter gracilis]|uniref:Zinc finger CHCC-type domain-containing protein n=1 Tax=Roseiterribacter gracilis TaxID=2812848 RepID=A0A8S8XEA1_9PROT|nr:hypothetical protein TMPK1_40000 [Rhodospirillales bacterium TMPK1]